MNVAIVGSREFDNYLFFKNEVDKILLNINVREIISGGARGVDTLAIKYAREREIPYRVFYPQWETLGKKAGIIRNIDIVDSSDLCIAFWNGLSRGTYFTLK